MATIAHEPVQHAMNRIRQLSADEEARRLAFVRERALHDEVSFLNEAKREGREEGRQEGEQIGMQRGRQEGRQEGERIGMQKGERIGIQKTAQATARNLIALGMLTDGQIAQATGLSVAQVEALRNSPP